MNFYKSDQFLSIAILSKFESVKFSLIESIICHFTDSSVKKYFSLLNQLIFTDESVKKIFFTVKSVNFHWNNQFRVESRVDTNGVNDGDRAQKSYNPSFHQLLFWTTITFSVAQNKTSSMDFSTLVKATHCFVCFVLI